MNVMLRVFVSPLVRPCLGVGVVAVLLIYAASCLLAVLLKPDFRSLLSLAIIPVFWVSLRVLLKTGRPPQTVRGGVLFGLMLLIFVGSLLGLLGLVFGLASELGAHS
jgi:hypothetical protein